MTIYILEPTQKTYIENYNYRMHTNTHSLRLCMQVMRSVKQNLIFQLEKGDVGSEAT